MIEYAKVMSFFKEWYKRNDLAHGWQHINDVHDTAVMIVKEYYQNADINVVRLAALAHDMFANDRDLHHDLAGDWVIKNMETIDGIGDRLSHDRLINVSHCVREHRASYKGDYYSLESMVVSAADRGVPSVNPDGLYVRSFKHGYKKFNGECELIVNNAFNHINEKYGVGGYARYNEVYMDIWGDVVRERAIAIDNMSRDQVMEIYYGWKK